MQRYAKSYEFESRSAQVYNEAGESVGSIALDPSIFGRTPNVPLMHQVVVGQLAGVRAGTQSTKTRSEVSGGGAKPFRQKGTGNARQGSTRAPHFSGGGVALGPKPRSYEQRTPKKMISQALWGALSDRASADAILVLEGFSGDTPSTQKAQSWIEKRSLHSSVLLVVGPEDEVLAKSFRNLSNVEVAFPSNLSAYLVLVNDAIVFTKTSVPGGAGEVEAPKKSRTRTTKSAVESTPHEEAAAVAEEA